MPGHHERAVLAGDELHHDAVLALRTWVAPDEAQEQLRTSYLDLLRRNRDGLSRACVPAHLTASAVVLTQDGDRVLLVLHRKGGFWVQPGGHCEPSDRSLAGAALREAVEESGIEDLRLAGSRPVDLDRHRLAASFGGCGEHLDVRYLVLAPSGAEPVRSDESDDVRWFGVDGLPGDLADGVAGLVRRAQQRLRSAQSTRSSRSSSPTPPTFSPAAAETPSR